MTEEEDFFKENFPEYVTEKGEFLSPYWDLFRAGVICAIFEIKVKIEQLEKENAELKEQIGDVIECFTSSSIGDDFEMAESAREVMEVLNMQCYRHGKVKSKLTEAKEIIRALLFHLNKDTFAVIYETKKESIEKAEDFLKESE